MMYFISEDSVKSIQHQTRSSSLMNYVRTYRKPINSGFASTSKESRSDIHWNSFYAELKSVRNLTKIHYDTNEIAPN